MSFSATGADGREPQTVHVSGDRTSAITGTFTLTHDNNGTTVRCIAAPDTGSGNNDFGQTTPAIMHGQGMDGMTLTLIIVNNSRSACMYK